jgi:hypothetical protein
MKNKIIDFLKKYKLYILGVLFVFYFFRSCTKSTQIKKLNREIDNNGVSIDSLETVIKLRKQKIDSFPELTRIEKINIHLEYDDWISSKDRGPQLMELHTIVKNKVKELQKK